MEQTNGTAPLKQGWARVYELLNRFRLPAHGPQIDARSKIEQGPSLLWKPWRITISV